MQDYITHILYMYNVYIYMLVFETLVNSHRPSDILFCLRYSVSSLPQIELKTNLNLTRVISKLRNMTVQLYQQSNLRI